MPRIISINYGEDDEVEVAAMALSREELVFLCWLTGSMTEVAANAVLESGARIIRDIHNEILDKMGENFGGNEY